MKGLITELKQRLKQPLPGFSAQIKMSARPSSGDNFDFKHQESPKMGGVALLLYPKEGIWRMPLMRRPSYQGVHGGQISFPGGRMEPQDHDIIHTAIRETAEEIGVQIPREKVLGTLSPLYIMASNYQVVPMVAVANHQPFFKTDPREVQELIEADLQHLLSVETIQKKEIQVRGMPIIAPYFEVQKQVVWGATAMILSEFLEVLRDVHSS